MSTIADKLCECGHAEDQHRSEDGESLFRCLVSGCRCRDFDPPEPADDWEVSLDLVHHNTRFEAGTPEGERAARAVLAGIRYGREEEAKRIAAIVAGAMSDLREAASILTAAMEAE